ncbi:hypothetical protein KBI33_03515 [Candidatus Shapirobacteria bacterium]|nr:hypothetical protein [Candidatus Shapirobacteria bacterium]
MEIKSAAFATLSYFNLFSYPLLEEEVWYWLPIKAGRQEVKKALEELKKERKIVAKDGFYFLPQNKKIEERKKKESYAEKKIKKAKKAAQILGFLPGVLLVGLTGNLAMKAAQEEDDIDFLIITRSGWLWRSRFWAIILLEVLGWRRRPNQKKVCNKICLNLFLDENYLALAKERQDLYTAHEILQMRPLVNKAGTYQRFLAANFWAASFLPQAFKGRQKEWPKAKAKNLNSPRDIFPCFGEKLLAYLQLKKIKAHQGSEEILSGQLFFHPHDRRLELMGKYREVVKEDICH